MFANVNINETVCNVWIAHRSIDMQFHAILVKLAVMQPKLRVFATHYSMVGVLFQIQTWIWFVILPEERKKKTKQRWIMATALFIRNPSLSFWSFKLIYDMLSHSHFKWVGVNDIQKKLTALKNANHSYKSTQFTHITY